MYWDKLCGIAEKFVPDLISDLNKSKLFLLPGRAHEFLPKEIDEEQVNFLGDNMFLPFEITALEDSAGVTILLDLFKDSRGLLAKRGFIDCVFAETPLSEFREGVSERSDEYNKIRNSPEFLEMVKYGLVSITWGIVDRLILNDKTRLSIEGNVFRLLQVFTKAPKGMNPILHEALGIDMMPKDMWKPALTNALTAFEEIMYVNTPSKIIVENSLTKKREAKKGHILRSHERPTYTMWTPKEIHEHTSQNPGIGTPLIEGHERSAHFRQYRHERFTKMKGKTIIVKACWVGPITIEKGNRIYKIMVNDTGEKIDKTM